MQRQKQHLQAESNDKYAEKEKYLNELRAIRETTRGPINLEALEDKIRELDFKLNHESLNVAEEKRCREMKEKAERQDRPAMARAVALQAKIDEVKAAITQLQDQIKAVNGQLDKIKKAQDGQQAILDNIRSKENDVRADIPNLHVEKKECWDIIQALRAKQKEIRDAFNEKWTEFKKQDTAYRGWFREERKKRCVATWQATALLLEA